MLPDSSVSRVLIYRLGSLGDTTVALPGFHLIERSFPNAQRILLTNFPVHAKAPASAAVLGASGLVHGYMRYSAGTRNPLELMRLAFEIRRFRPQVLIYLMPVRSAKQVQRDLTFFRVGCGIRRVVGASAASESKRRIDPVTGRFQSESHRLAELLLPLGDADPDDLRNWDLRLTPAEHARAAAALGPLGNKPMIACGPGTKMQAKDWGVENWRTLLESLQSRYPTHGLVLIGAAEDRSEAVEAASSWRGPQVNLCGELTPRETAAVLARALLFLGPDSGPMHLADAVGTPAVIAFSARGLPGVWFPVGTRHQVVYHQTSCYGCNLETCIEQQRRCLLSITPQEMFTACERALGTHTPGIETPLHLSSSNSTQEH